MKTLKENFLIAHQIGLQTSIAFGLLLLLLGSRSAGWLGVILLMYLISAGLVASAPYLFGDEMMAAAATAMAGLNRRVQFVPPPTAVFQQAPQAAILVMKTASPFL